MAPIKFEENIREKLEARSLQPSVDAWQKLEQKLYADSKKRSKNKFWWFGIAACLVGVLFVIKQLVTFDEINPITTPVIVNEGNDILIKTLEPTVVNDEIKNIVREEAQSRENIQLVTSSNKTKISKLKVKQEAIVNFPNTTKNEDTVNALNQTEISNQGLVADVLDIADSTLVSKTAIATAKNSDSEIETLLVAAHKEIQLGDDKVKSTFTVDANALLQDVETEMPPSLRGQLFKVIEKNFKTAKTAVATRNE